MEHSHPYGNPPPYLVRQSSSSMDIDDRISIRSFDQSVYSYNSSRDSANLLRAVQGRTFNNQNPLYFLPADETEWSRLDKQHLMLLLAVGNLYAAPHLVRARLAPEPTVHKSVLDLGTGGGIWAISVAQEFPHVEVVGVDLAPSTTRPPPANCRFEFDDVNLGLPHYYGKFDVVHARSAANGLNNYETFIAECAKCLKPGGIILLTEGDFQLYDHNKQKQPVAVDGGGPKQSWFQRMLFESYHIMKNRGSSMDAGYMLNTYLSRNDWFENAGSQEIWCPVGPWEPGTTPEDTHIKRSIGTLMRQNTIEFVRALRPLFLSEGYPADLVEQWIERTDHQLSILTPRLYTKWHYGWATLKADCSTPPVQPLPVPPSPYGIPWPLEDFKLAISKAQEAQETMQI